MYHDFHSLLIAAKFLTAELHSRYFKESGIGVGVGNFGKVRVEQGPNFLENVGRTNLHCLRFDDVTMFTQP